MVFTDQIFKYFSLTQSKIRAAIAGSASGRPFGYEDESFFDAYAALYQFWVKRKSQRETADLFSVGRHTLKEWEKSFIDYGGMGLLPTLSFVDVDSRLEQLVILIQSARPHENSSYALRLANALDIPGATLDLIRRIQRSHGYGQRLDDGDISFYTGLQHILTSIAHLKSKKKKYGHDKIRRAETFINFDKDSFQQRIELFKVLSSCSKKRKVREILLRYGIHQNRYYALKNRFMIYGVWGLVDLVNTTRIKEKISPELELKIIEERLISPSLSANKILKKLDLGCSRSNVLAIYAHWSLAQIKTSISIRGVVSLPEEKIQKDIVSLKKSAKTLFPNLITTDNLKVNSGFKQLMKYLVNRKVPVSNPGAIIIAPFLDQMGVVEALHTYVPDTYRNSEITNNIIVNVLRIIAGFPSINDFTLNCDRSVAIGAGLSLNPRKSRFYDSFDDLRFKELAELRNDAGIRAKELGIIEAKEIAIDYHCDQSDSRYPRDKNLSKAPDKNGNMVYAHRPQILWDSATNSIINIAYCEGRSRAPTALYNYLEENLFKIIAPAAIEEIFADSEYTGEKQLVYLIRRSNSSVTMCLKQNKKIEKWKKEILASARWEPYGEKYRIASRDFSLPETGKMFRVVVKQKIENNEIRCFGSTHMEYSPKRILDLYHLRWPVETGIKDLIENYFLNKPTGTSAEKIELHYYCVMLARQVVDYFLSVFCRAEWKTPEEWECVLSTVRTTLFSNQNCNLSVDDDNNILLTYLDGDPLLVKKHLSSILENRDKANLNKVSWWGGRGVKVKVIDKYNLKSGAEIR